MCEGSSDVGKYLKNFTITNNNNKKILYQYFFWYFFFHLFCVYDVCSFVCSSSGTSPVIWNLILVALRSGICTSCICW